MNITEIKPTDILFVQVPVGNMPLSRSEEYLTKVKDMIKEVFDNRLLLTPIRGGNWDELGGIKIEILRKVL